MLLALANPLIVHETREGLPNIVALIVDRSQSMEIGTRRADADKALAAYREQLKALNVEVREAEVLTTTDAGPRTAARPFAALNAALSDVPPDRVAGAILITDGEVHDAPDPKHLPSRRAVACAADRRAGRARPQAHRRARDALRHRRQGSADHLPRR